MVNYDINRPLRLGEVRTFSSATIAQFNVNRTTNKIDLLMDNTDFKYQDLNCALSKRVIRDIYIIFRDLYNELEEEESEDKE